MDVANVGVIGCGGMARDLARRCVRLGRARIAAVSDPDPNALQEAALEFNAEPEADFAALCHRPNLDAVIVGSPPAAHMDNVLAAAAGGKHVFCEKPLAVSVAQCNRMIEACRSADVTLFVGQVLRLFPLFWHSHVLVSQGAIGQPRAISVTRAGHSPGFAGTWRARRDLAGGTLLEINAHELDYMRLIMGEPAEVYARTDRILGYMDYEDQAFVMVGFVSGGSGVLHSSLSSPAGEYRVHIQGTAGNILHGGFGGTLRRQRLAGDAEEVHPADVSVPDPYDNELSSWLDTVVNGQAPRFSGEDGRMAVAMAEAAYRSAELGRPVRIDELTGAPG